MVRSEKSRMNAIGPIMTSSWNAFGYHLVIHSSYVESNVVTDHGINHHEHHDNCENNVLLLVFGIKISFIISVTENVLFVHHLGGNVSVRHNPRFYSSRWHMPDNAISVQGL